MKTELEAWQDYAKELRGLLVKTILSFSEAGWQGSAEKLEDAMDHADAMVGDGPYSSEGEVYRL